MTIQTAAPRVIAEFCAQVWIGDNACSVEPQGANCFDVTLEVIEAGPDYDWADDNYGRDDLRHAPTAPAWASDWSGPFEVEMEAAAAASWGTMEEQGIDLATMKAELQAERAALKAKAALRPYSVLLLDVDCVGTHFAAVEAENVEGAIREARSAFGEPRGMDEEEMAELRPLVVIAGHHEDLAA